MRERHTLRDRDILRWIMEHPGRGHAYSVRALASQAGCSRAVIGHLLTGERVDVMPKTADHIAEALGVATLVLFTPSASTESDDPSSEVTEKET